MKMRALPICLLLLLAQGTRAEPGHTLPACEQPQLPNYMACRSAEAPLRSVAPAAGATIWRSGEYLDFRWRGPASAVRIEGADGSYGFELMQREPGLWSARIRVPGLARLSESFTFVASGASGAEPLREKLRFVGPAARPVANVQQRLRRFTLQSRELGAEREVVVWFPPGYAADRTYPVIYVADRGADLGDELLDAMNSGRMPPTVLVGIDRCEDGPFCRFQEYVDVRPDGEVPADPERFAAHERFFIEELMPWAESTLHVSALRAQRSVAGFSNGADWAAAMALRHPELFGRAIVMSPIMAQAYVVAARPDVRFDISAGALEPPFAFAAQVLARRLACKGGAVQLQWWPHTHSIEQWRAAFPAAVMATEGGHPVDVANCEAAAAGSQDASGESRPADRG